MSVKNVIPSLEKVVDVPTLDTTSTDEEQVIDTTSNTEPGATGGGDDDVDTEGGKDTTPAGGNSSSTTPDNGGSDSDSEYEDTLNLLATPSNTLSAEDAEVKANLLKLVKGTKTNEKGEILDDAGRVVLSNEDLEQLLLSGNLPKDKDGNLINSAGDILEGVEEGSILALGVREVIDELGITLPDELLDALADDKQSVGNIVKEVAKKAKMSAISTFLEANPTVGDFFRHLSLGGTPETYSTAVVDYNKVNLKDLDKESKLKLVSDLYAKKGITSSGSLLSVLSKAGEEEINIAASDALKELKAHQANDVKQRKEAYEAAQAKEVEENKKYWEARQAVITKGTIGQNLVIPDAEKDAFFNYIALPANDEGYSQDQLDEMEMSIEDELMLAYLRFKKGNLDTLIKSRAGALRASSLKERLARYSVTSDVSDKTAKTVRFPTLEKLTNRGN